MKYLWTLLLLLTTAVFPALGEVPVSNHVFLVVFENHSYEDVVGNANMPYLNALASQYGLATKYYANSHYSLPNYLWLHSGQYLTLDDGSTQVFDVDNTVRQLLTAGKTWKGYFQSLPSVGYTGGPTGAYVRDHNPFVYFSDVMNSSTQTQNIVPLTEFATDLQNGTLPDYSLMVPDNDHNGHNGSLSTADQWLEQNVGPLLASPMFQPGGDGILIVTFDEGGLTDCRPATSCPSLPTNVGGGRVATIVASPKAISGYQSTTFYQHPSALRTMLEALGASGFPGASASAPDMAEFFSASAATPPPPAPTVTISSPSANATVGSPVTVSASFNRLATYMKLWVDGTSTYISYSNTLNTTIDLAAGTHTLGVQAMSGGTIYRRSESITVSSGSTAPAVTISSPAANSTVSSPVTVNASFNGTASYMKLWVDGAAKYTTYSSTLNTSVPLATGQHRLVVQASSGGTIYSAVEYITVSTSPSTTPTVTISSPAANSTVSSPVAVSASFSGTADYMKLWVDGTAVYTVKASTLSTSVTLGSGKHRLVVQASSGGTIYSSVEYVTVQ